MHRVALPVVASACMVACAAVGPNYVEPLRISPASFANAVPTDATALSDATAFWASFSDVILSDLVTHALAANLDIRIAEANLREARGLRGEVRGSLFPDADLHVSATRARLDSTQLPGTTISQRTNTNLSVEFDAGWELDLFGGIRRSVEAASAEVGAAAADLDAMRISVAAETARTYFELRGLQRRLRVATENLRTQLDTLNIITVRFDAGRGTEFDVARARAQAETTRATVPALQAEIARTLYALAVLSGRPPESMSSAPAADEAGSTRPSTFAVRDPVALLRRRPDVAAAERRLAAASAGIGISTAELFPAVTLLGNVGLGAVRVGDLSRGNAVRSSIGPALTWNLLNFGRIRSRIEQADARYDGSLAAYEKTVLRALQEADGALVSVYRLDEQLAAVFAAVESARIAARLATDRYDAGATDLLNVLDAQRQVLAAEDSLSQVRTARVVASVALFKAMGGALEDPIAVHGGLGGKRSE